MALGFLSLPSLLKGVLGNVPSFDAIQAKFMKDFKKQLDANAARGAARLVGSFCHKAIGAAMNENTGIKDVEQRVAIGTALAKQIAGQVRQFADQIEAHAGKQAARERTRGTGEEAEALEAREASEEETEQDAIDIVRAGLGQNAREDD